MLIFLSMKPNIQFLQSLLQTVHCSNNCRCFLASSFALFTTWVWVQHCLPLIILLIYGIILLAQVLSNNIYIVSLYRFALHPVLTNSLCLKTKKGSFWYIDRWCFDSLDLFCSIVLFTTCTSYCVIYYEDIFKHVRHPIITKY